MGLVDVKRRLWESHPPIFPWVIEAIDIERVRYPNASSHFDDEHRKERVPRNDGL